jgi:hypothetical protein
MPGNDVNCPVSETLTRFSATTKAVARNIFAAAAAGFAAVSLAAPASAGPLVLDEYVDVAKCDQKSGQLCPPVVYRQAYIDTPSVKVEFTASGNHCSDIIAHVFVDGREWGSNVVGPGQSDGGYEIPIEPAGLHKFGVQAEGITGGCNTGQLDSWGGALHIEELLA